MSSHAFLRCGDYLKFLMGCGKFRQKGVTSYMFFAVETILSVWGDLESFDKKMWPVTHFFAVQTILSVWWDLESFDKKVWPVTRFSLWRLSQVFEGTWKVSTKRSAQLHVFFAVETNLSFWRDLEKFSQKNVPSHMFLRCGDYLKFLMGLRKTSTKICAQLHVFFAVETNLSF